MKIKVTAEDIAKGKRRVTWQCPVALALRREANEPVMVGHTACFTASGRGWELPTEAVIFIYNFDTGESVSPFEFELCSSR